MKNTPLPNTPEKGNMPETLGKTGVKPEPNPDDKTPVPVATQPESKEDKDRKEARAILQDRRDIEPGCPVPQRMSDIPPARDY